MHRRTVLALAAASAVWPTWPARAQGAADYPNKPVRLVVPYAPGGIADLLGRLVAEKLGTMWKQPVVVENRPGAGGHVGAEQVAKGPPDGHTLVLATIAHNGAASMYRGLKYDPAVDLVPAVLVAESAGVLIVHPSVSAKTVPEFIALAKAQPGRLAYASAGNGSAIHMATELFKFSTGTDLMHVPYKGSTPAMADLLSGQVQLMFENIMTAHPQIKAGKVRALGVTGRSRNASLPDVPTIAESGVPGYAAEPWYTISVARGTPPDVLRKLNADLNTALKSPDLAQRWESLGVTPLGGTLEDAARRNAAEAERWARVIQAARIQAD
ncbi:MAG: tripartite tricarboxylate transporter substrate binding protein [Rubrivivax sp.]|nr:tripartite tricarboxylate transporter substrate binding protein [Rubrivivax sp.]